MKKFMLHLLLSIAMLLPATALTGCEDSRKYDNNPDKGIWISTGQEVELGSAVVKEVHTQHKPWNDPAAKARLDNIAKRLIPQAKKDRGDLEYRFHLLDTPEVNAFAVPGGDMFVLRGLMQQATSDDELAGVLAHELAHITYRHSIRQLQKQYETGVFVSIVAAVAGDEGTSAHDTAEMVASLTANVMSLSYSRDHESQADRMGLKYLYHAGYDPRGLINFFKKLEKNSPSQPKIFTFFSTHPGHDQRIADLEKEIADKRYYKK